MPARPPRPPDRPSEAVAGLQVPPAENRRSLLVGEARIAYELRRSRRRTIGLTIDARGLRVGAPLRASIREIETLIVRHGDWVLNKLQAWAARPERPRLAVEDGACVPVLGRQITLRLRDGARPPLWQDDELALTLRRGTDVGAALERALRARALTHFSARLQHFAARLGVEIPALALSNARTRWGSCSRTSGIRIHWRLVFCPPHLVDYVIAHEVAHLREMNHSPRFWAVVASLYPEWQRARRELRAIGEQLPHLA